MNAKKLFWILFLLNLFNYIDRQVLYSVFPLLQAELRLNDMHLGALASAFMLVYMFYAPFVGYFADRTPRQNGLAQARLFGARLPWPVPPQKAISPCFLREGLSA